jgi:hypothetical protein
VFTTHAAALILAMHETPVRRGIAAAESYRLIYDIGWSVYRQMAEPPLLIASAFTRDPRKRLKLATDLFRSFPFSNFPTTEASTTSMVVPNTFMYKPLRVFLEFRAGLIRFEEIGFPFEDRCQRILTID